MFEEGRIGGSLSELDNSFGNKITQSPPMGKQTKISSERSISTNTRSHFLKTTSYSYPNLPCVILKWGFGHILPITVESSYSDTLWNHNFSRTVAGITKWFWVNIEGYLGYLPPKFEDLVPTSLGSGAIRTSRKCVTVTADYCTQASRPKKKKKTQNTTSNQ